MNREKYIIREMSRDELARYAITWAEAEGWHPGNDDFDYFYQTDPHGFFLGVLNNEPIAAISAVKYGDDFGFIGLYLVKPDYRGQGFGLAIWQHAIDYLQGRNMGLDGVIAQQPNYQKSGFKTAYRNLRYQTQGLGQAYHHPNLVELNQVAVSAVQDYDAPVFPADRRDFIRRWIVQKQGTALGILCNGELAGYGVIRACQNNYYKIGGLYADNTENADILLQALLSYAPANSQVFLDIPEVNPAAVALVNKYNMTTLFETARMYTKTPPVVDLDKTFGITTFELG
jgi:GNAT superfamily N-acetyltransferase